MKRIFTTYSKDDTRDMIEWLKKNLPDYDGAETYVSIEIIEQQ